MQSNKASKKTRKIAAEPTAAAPETNAAAEVTAKPRTSRSSKTKKAESELGSVKHHHKANANVVSESAPVSSTPAVMAAAAGAAVTSNSVKPGLVESASAPTLTPKETISPIEEAEVGSRPVRVVAHQEIAELAYSYWAARGYAEGSSEEDWFRAERELNARR